MSDKECGLYKKFSVFRNDGSSLPGQKHHGCDYFVLDLTHDKFAALAPAAYADACENDYPLLASDLRKKIEVITPQEKGEPVPVWLP